MTADQVQAKNQGVFTAPRNFEEWWATAPKRDPGTVLAVAYWYARDAWDAATASQFNGWAAHDEAVQEIKRAHDELRSIRAEYLRFYNLVKDSNSDLAETASAEAALDDSQSSPESLDSTITHSNHADDQELADMGFSS